MKTILVLISGYALGWFHATHGSISEYLWKLRKRHSFKKEFPIGEKLYVHKPNRF